MAEKMCTGLQSAAADAEAGRPATVAVRPTPRKPEIQQQQGHRVRQGLRWRPRRLGVREAAVAEAADAAAAAAGERSSPCLEKETSESASESSI